MCPASFCMPVVLIAWPTDSLLTFHYSSCWLCRRVCVSDSPVYASTDEVPYQVSLTRDAQQCKFSCGYAFHVTKPSRGNKPCYLRLSTLIFPSSNSTNDHTHTHTIFLRHRSSSAGPKDHKFKYFPKFSGLKGVPFTLKQAHIGRVHILPRDFCHLLSLQRRKYSLPLWAPSRSCALGPLLLPHRTFYCLRTLSL